MQTDHPTPEGQSTVADAPPTTGWTAMPPRTGGHGCACRAPTAPSGPGFAAALLVGIGLAMMADRPAWQGPVDRGRLRRGRHADARRRLHMERHHRPRHRRQGGARARARSPGQVTVTGGAGLAGGAGAGGLRHPADALGAAAIILGIASLGLVAIYPCQALHPVAAGVSGAGVSTGACCWLGGAYGQSAPAPLLAYVAGTPGRSFMTPSTPIRMPRTTPDRRQVHRAAVRADTPRWLAGFRRGLGRVGWRWRCWPPARAACR